MSVSEQGGGKFGNFSMFGTFLLGAALPLAPLAGRGVLLAFVWLFLVARLLLLLNSKRHTPLLQVICYWTCWAWGWLMVLACWCIAYLVFDFPGGELRAFAVGLSGEGGYVWQDVGRWLAQAPPRALSSLAALLKFVALVGLVAHFWRLPRERERFFSGLIAGLVIAALLTTLQLLGVWPTLFANQTPFWSELGRAAGTFTDPNAFGIFAVLVLPLLLERAFSAYKSSATCLAPWVRLALALLAVAWCGLALFSGSRSFLLGLSLLFLVALWLRNKRFFALAVGLAMLVVGFWNLLLFLTPELGASIVQAIPVTLSRFALGLNLAEWQDTLFSRLVFFRIALAMWFSAPLFGVGFNRFRDELPHFREAAQADIGLWVDNANNFYLGVLAETGLLGFLLLLIAFFSLSWRSDRESLAERISAVLLLLLLFLGPHLDFEEVAILSAYIISGAFLPKPYDGSRIRWRIIAVCLMLGVIIFRASSLQFGLHSVEPDGEGGLLSWSRSQARLQLSCAGDNEGVANLKVRSLHPERSPMPEITLSFHGQRVSRQLADSEPLAFSIPCQGKNRVVVKLRVAPPWMPARFSYGKDSRMLGVQILDFSDDSS